MTTVGMCPVCDLPLMMSRGMLRCPGCVYAEPAEGYPESKPEQEEREDSDG